MKCLNVLYHIISGGEKADIKEGVNERGDNLSGFYGPQSLVKLVRTDANHGRARPGKLPLSLIHSNISLLV